VEPESNANHEERSQNPEVRSQKSEGRTSASGYLPSAFCLLFLSGCAVGPDFEPPAAPAAAGYTAAPLVATSTTTNVVGGEAQSFVEGMDIPGEWWALFQSKPLSDLIERALKNNPNITSAQAALVAAREFVLAQKGAFFPSLTTSFSASRNKTANTLSPATASGDLYYNLFTPQVSVAYVPDVFGLNRRSVETLKAQAEQQRYALIATHITLSANVAAAAIQEASLRAQIAATRQLIECNTRALKILRDQFEKGYTNRLAVAAQEAQLAQVAATLPPLLKQLAQQRDLLAALAGAFPNQELAEKFELAGLQLPRQLPVSLPSKLVEQRPDVRQAGENFHVACAQVGVAIANRLPNLTLTANGGNAALAANQMMAGGAGFFTLGAQVTEPMFDGFTLMHKERAARAAFVLAAEQYRGTVVTAFQNVADTLNAVEQDGEGLKAAAAAADAARVLLDLTRQQMQTGYTNYLALLGAEQAYQQAMIALVQAQANRYADTVALFQALGGGWWHRADLQKTDKQMRAEVRAEEKDALGNPGR
jgi:NodT family efflux transporter outer membrane factor (OMF) lipoprotein